MPVPTPIGKVHYDEPRAVMVREPGHLDKVHSAVHGAVAVYTASESEAKKLMASWAQVMTVLDAEVAKVLATP